MRVELYRNGLNMLGKILQRIRETPNEDALSIVEIIIAFAIIVGVLLGSAMLMGYSFTTQSTSEGRDKAVQVSRDIIEETRQIPWREFGVEADRKDASVFEGGMGGDTDYNGEDIYFLPAGQTSSLTFSPYQEKFVGEHTFTVRTYITSVNKSSFDGTLPVQATNEIPPRRITVVTTWETPEGDQTVVETWVRAPVSSECIPTYAFSGLESNKPVGCK
ncbi:MAG: hypothetical protein H9W81_12855 [Enterococcus sp.]|nr:hypothetical protein [Enterococcus sp.]